MDLMRRVDELEWMDTRAYPLPVMRETLRFLAITNQYFGGARVMIRFFEECSKKWQAGQEIRLLDVGTGGAEIPVAIARWARRKGFRLSILAIDLVDEVVSVARENVKEFPEISVKRADVFDIDAAEKFDYVLASLLLHHISPQEGARLLRVFDALSTRGFVISDLLRSPASYGAVWALSHILGNDIVRHDGPLSVRRAFRPMELTALAVEAGLPYLRAQQEAWFRVSLSGEKRAHDK